ncbi:3-hydroxyacyl-CoA dehydrogenase family protein [Aquabacterium sp. J223]|uniref:3-hydroxyacyl-CoA dehydrogenase family protein n=1 Tax=Aquabacterium sp. J223 TaxID=2898431 RepID=UPI0021ADF25E|nr:3-hydroxyacyl-CoA dehydrogenase NAD-binding domain-containing protein [Aquabacterium sp. J223]UUX95248.1 3-hydroxyacyl-CoA dehydrogenase NAD-binding domain-containing protein [Aquabacterium sp. J223]
MKALTVTVVGGGMMGHGIAQVFARAGHAVVISDPSREVLDAALARIGHNLAAEGADPERVLCNIVLEAALDAAVANADLVIEAVPEKLALKQRLFAQIAAAAPAHAVLASNTSVIPITRIGEALPLDARARLVGTHWWNPPHLVPLVEVVRTDHTLDTVFRQAFGWLESVGKRPVEVKRDVAGFIGNRLQHALWREAISLIENGVCDAASIDLVVKNSFGMRLSVLGPMENADLVGLELTRDVHGLLFPELSRATAPSPLLDRLLDAGHGGMAAGRGLRDWTPEQVAGVRERLTRHLIRLTQRPPMADEP